MKLYFSFLCFSLMISQSFSQKIIPLNTKNEKQTFVFDSIYSKIQNKRIICIGETQHRIETFSRCKSELVKYLHEKCGYNILAFEGSLMKISNAYYNIANDSLALKESLYRIWQTESVLELFCYVKMNMSSSNPLILSGFDVKSGASRSVSLWLKNIFKSVNPSFAESIYRTDTLFIIKTTPFDHSDKLQPISEKEEIIFQTFYSSVIDSLENYKKRFIDQRILSANQFSIVKQSLINRKYLAKFVTFKDIKMASSYRDSIMTKNILWLTNDLYKNEKIIIWAADAHISKKTVKNYSEFNQRSSIEMLPAELKDQTQTISLNFIKQAPKDIKKQIYLLPGNAFFIDHPDYMNEEFEGVIYFKETESFEKYIVK